MRRKKTWFVVVIVLAHVIGAGAFVVSRMGGSEEVIVLCGGSMRAPLEELIQEYRKVSDDVVRGTYGGSGELCAQIQEGARCDVFISHDPFMPWAAERGLVTDWKMLGYVDLVVVVRKNDPKTAGITRLAELARPGLRLGIGDQTYSTSGQIVKAILKKLPEKKGFLANVRLETRGHQKRCIDVSEGSLDVAIVWEPVARQFADKLRLIDIRAEYIQLVDTVTSPTYKVSDLRNIQVTVGLTATAKGRPQAKAFYDFVLERAPAVFKAKGFRMPE